MFCYRGLGFSSLAYTAEGMIRSHIPPSNGMSPTAGPDNPGPCKAYPSPVLGAVAPFLSNFSEKIISKKSSKRSFE